MRNPLPLAAFGLVSALALTLATDASAQMRLLSDGPQVELRDMVARVVVTPEDRSDVDIRVRYGKAKVPTLMVSHRGNVTVLNGHLNAPVSTSLFNFRININDLSSNADAGSVFIAGMGKVDIADLPLVYIRVPNNAVVKDSSDSYGHINPSQSLDLIMNGGGDWSVDPVSGPLNVINSGSGNLHVTSAGDAIVDNMGSGDIDLNAVRSLKVSLTGSGSFVSNQSTNTELQNQGSGDVVLGHVGNIKVQLNGSGDLSMNSINGMLTLSNYGSSDVHIGQLGGPVTLDLSGSGDVDIDHGQANAFTLSGSGSGDVDFGGIAGTVRIDSNGSGDVSILKATGAVVTKVNGSGEMHIGH